MLDEEHVRELLAMSTEELQSIMEEKEQTECSPFPYLYYASDDQLYAILEHHPTLDLSRPNVNGTTLLMLTVYNHSSTRWMALLRHGVEPLVQDKRGATFLHRLFYSTSSSIAYTCMDFHRMKSMLGTDTWTKLIHLEDNAGNTIPMLIMKRMKYITYDITYKQHLLEIHAFLCDPSE